MGVWVGLGLFSSCLCGWLRFADGWCLVALVELLGLCFGCFSCLLICSFVFVLLLLCDFRVGFGGCGGVGGTRVGFSVV